ncbi:MAG: GlmU family protein [Saprospiraceae bacterium]|nr:GlmU family protein [Saprospiraceae bacterium]
MKNIILFDPDTRDQLLPLTFTRPVSELRVGVTTISEKWAQLFGGRISHITQDYLSEKYPIEISDDNFVINGSVLPNPQLCKMIGELNNNEAFQKDGELIAARLDRLQFQNLMEDNDIEELVGFELEHVGFDTINYVWDVFSLNGKILKEDFQWLTEGRESAPLSKSNQIVGDPSLIFLEEGAVVECATLNTKKGPIYIGQGAEIMEGCHIRGPFAMCEDSLLKMGAKIYGATTLGPCCKVGGEVNNVVLLGYSSKAHEGYLGNSVIGEWCNLGADTNTSNLKNTYEEVKLWDYTKNSFGRTGLQFLGLIMGDHSKCGINTMFNTGTVVGVSANIFGAGFPRNFIPSFSWGGPQGYETYDLKKAFYTMERVLDRRSLTLSVEDHNIFKHIFEITAQYRSWEKG